MAARRKTPKRTAAPKRKAARKATKRKAPSRNAQRQLPNDDAWRALVETAIEQPEPGVSAAPRRRSK